MATSTRTSAFIANNNKRTLALVVADVSLSSECLSIFDGYIADGLSKRREESRKSQPNWVANKFRHGCRSITVLHNDRRTPLFTPDYGVHCILLEFEVSLNLGGPLAQKGARQGRPASLSSVQGNGLLGLDSLTSVPSLPVPSFVYDTV
jgi:hypothetical protein